MKQREDDSCHDGEGGDSKEESIDRNES
jgi:hypothetical protein